MKFATVSRPVVTVLAAAALLLSACGDDDTDPVDNGDGTASTTTTEAEETVDTTTTLDTEPEPPADEGTVFDVTVEGDSVDGGGRQSVTLGDTVTIRVTSDVADHIHLHGYDVMVDVAAGEPAELTFDATIPGVFEVELEDSRLQLLELEIS